MDQIEGMLSVTRDSWVQFLMGPELLTMSSDFDTNFYRTTKAYVTVVLIIYSHFTCWIDELL